MKRIFIALFSVLMVFMAKCPSFGQDGFTCILDAINKNDNVGLERLVVQYPGALFEKQKPSGNTALHFAAFRGKSAGAAVLIRAGAPVNQTNARGDTPLHFAAWWGDLPTMKLLAESGADPELKNNEGRTAIYSAIRSGRIEKVKYLAGLGVNLKVKDKEGLTPEVFARRGKNNKIADYLKSVKK